MVSNRRALINNSDRSKWISVRSSHIHHFSDTLQTWPPPFRVHPASVSLVCSFRSAEFASDTKPDCRPAKFDDSASRQTGLPQNTRATERHTAPLRPRCRFIPAARFRHSTELTGATKAALPFSVALRTQRRSRRRRAGERSFTLS